MIVLLVFLFGVGAVMGAYLAVTKLPGYLAQRKLDARLEEVTKVQDTTAEGGAELVKGNEEGFVPVIERFAAGSAQGMALQVWVEQSGASISLSALLLISSLCGVMAGFTVASALRMGVGWILGGALGNILDRARHGYVVDFADLHFGTFRPFLVFNVGDAAISIGVAILLLRAFLARSEEPKESVENA